MAPTRTTIRRKRERERQTEREKEKEGERGGSERAWLSGRVRDKDTRVDAVAIQTEGIDSAQCTVKYVNSVQIDRKKNYSNLPSFCSEQVKSFRNFDKEPKTDKKKNKHKKKHEKLAVMCSHSVAHTQKRTHSPALCN